MHLHEDVPCPSRGGMWCLCQLSLPCNRQLVLKLSQAKILLGYWGIADVNKEENEHEAICSPYTMASRMATLQTLIIRRGKCNIQIKQSPPQRYLGKQWHLTDSVVPAKPLKVVYHASSSNVLEILGQPFHFHENLISGWWVHLAMRFGCVGCVFSNGAEKKNLKKLSLNNHLPILSSAGKAYQLFYYWREKKGAMQQSPQEGC